MTASVCDGFFSCCGQRVAHHYRNERQVRFVGRDCLCDRSEERTQLSLQTKLFDFALKPVAPSMEPSHVFSGPPDLVGRVSAECRAPGDPNESTPLLCRRMILAAEIQAEDSQVLMASVMPLPGLQVMTENVFNLKQKIWKIEPNLFSMEEALF